MKNAKGIAQGDIYKTSQIQEVNWFFLPKYLFFFFFFRKMSSLFKKPSIVAEENTFCLHDNCIKLVYLCTFKLKASLDVSIKSGGRVIATFLIFVPFKCEQSLWN